mmetsp:Transcript_22201/g.62181  ORF Transcript_22201/g.62181 Transcript_22201/m.62181 type:complete len:564 (-) Transcript_22201:22-1713(-)
MGQGVNTGCSFGTLHLCQSEDSPSASGGLVLPARCECSGAGAAASQLIGRVDKAYSVDLAGDIWFPGSSSFSTALRGSKRNIPEPRILRLISKKRYNRDRFLRELEVLRSIDHPNLAKVHDAVDDPRFLTLVMEVAPGADLFSAVSACPSPRLSEWSIGQIVRQILAGLHHLHAAGLAHEDVQPRNIIAARSPMGPELRLKLIDYGFARKYSKGSTVALWHCMHCWAPEQVSESMSPRTTLAEPACDVWAAGAIAYALLSGHWPFDSDSPTLLRKKVKSGLWAFLPSESWVVSDRAKAFVTALMVANPAKRPSATQAMAHAFLKLDELDKNAIKPLARSPEIVQSLRRLAAWRSLQLELLHAIALQVGKSPQLIEALRKHLAAADWGTKGKQAVPFSGLRRALVQAGVQLPGRFLESLSVLNSSADTLSLQVQELCDTAADRRRGLEESALWACWTSVITDGAPAARRPDVVQVLDKGGVLLRQVFGQQKVNAVEHSVGKAVGAPELTTFDDLLARLRPVAAAQGLAVGGGSAAVSTELSTRLGGWRGSPDELAVRLPPVEDF